MFIEWGHMILDCPENMIFKCMYLDEHSTELSFPTIIGGKIYRLQIAHSQHTTTYNTRQSLAELFSTFTCLWKHEPTILEPLTPRTHVPHASGAHSRGQKITLVQLIRSMPARKGMIYSKHPRWNLFVGNKIRGAAI